MLVIAHVFTFTPFDLVLLFFPTFVCLLVPCTFHVNKFSLVFPNLCFIWLFCVGLILCYDCWGPSLLLGTYPKFAIVVTPCTRMLFWMFSKGKQPLKDSPHEEQLVSIDDDGDDELGFCVIAFQMLWFRFNIFTDLKNDTSWKWEPVKLNERNNDCTND